MLHFDFSISSPFTDNFGSVYDKTYSHKGWSLETEVCVTPSLLGFNLRVDGHKRDHPGINLAISLLGYEVSLHLYTSTPHREEDD